MPRVRPVEYNDASPEIRALYDAFGGPDAQLNVGKTIANHRDFLDAFDSLVRGLYLHNTLAPRLRELAYLRSSQLNRCHY
jgi:alkylhydroperoxidase family enzyme